MALCEESSPSEKLMNTRKRLPLSINNKRGLENQSKKEKRKKLIPAEEEPKSRDSAQTHTRNWAKRLFAVLRGALHRILLCKP